MKRSLEEFQKAIELSSDNPKNTVGAARIRLAQAYAFAGMKTEAMRILEQWNQSQRPRPQYYDIAVVYAGLGEKDKAFELLEQVYEHRDLNLLSVRTDPRLTSLRADPRYASLMGRVGLGP